MVDRSVLLRPKVQWHILIIPKPQEWLPHSNLPKLCEAEGSVVAQWDTA